MCRRLRPCGRGSCWAEPGPPTSRSPWKGRIRLWSAAGRRRRRSNLGRASLRMRFPLPRSGPRLDRRRVEAIGRWAGCAGLRRISVGLGGICGPSVLRSVFGRPPRVAGRLSRAVGSGRWPEAGGSRAAESADRRGFDLILATVRGFGFGEWGSPPTRRRLPCGKPARHRPQPMHQAPPARRTPRRLHARGVAGGHRRHRPAGRDPAAGARLGPGRGENELLPVEPCASWGLATGGYTTDFGKYPQPAHEGAFSTTSERGKALWFKRAGPLPPATGQGLQVVQHGGAELRPLQAGPGLVRGAPGDLRDQHDPEGPRTRDGAHAEDERRIRDRGRQHEWSQPEVLRRDRHPRARPDRDLRGRPGPRHALDHGRDRRGRCERVQAWGAATVAPRHGGGANMAFVDGSASLRRSRSSSPPPTSPAGGRSTGPPPIPRTSGPTSSSSSGPRTAA